MPETPNPKLRPMPPPTVSATRSPFAYAELDVKTNFSFLRGASHPDELVYRAAELGYRAIAVTDFNSLAGAVRMHEAAREVDLKLLIGARLTFSDAPDLLVWAPDREAYASLCRLLTLGKRRAAKGECELQLADFLEESAGLIAAVVTYGQEARRHAHLPPLPPGEGKGEGKPPGAFTTRSPLAIRPHPDPLPVGEGAEVYSSPLCLWPALSSLRDALGDRLSLAISCARGTDDESQLHHLLELSRTFGIPLLATNDVYYHDPARRMLQDVLTCVRHRCTIHEAGFKLFPNAERHLKSPQQMHRLFADWPQAIHRGLEIAERCHFKLNSLCYEYPDELVPAGKSATQYLSELTWGGAAKRYPDGIPDKVRELIAHELRLIEQLKFEPYFLTVYDLVEFARSRGILCQGRGSAANSAVCYCIGVTAVDPARIDVLFERFISAARNEPPDIDVDFEHERREEVIQYVYEKYGRDRAGMTATVITYRGRSAVRDVGKAMGLSLDIVDAMAAKLDWWDRGVLNDGRIRQCGLDPADRTIRLVIDRATELLGFPRHLSQHVGGMVMTRRPLCEMVPIENAAMEGRTVIEWDKDDIDVLGLLKVDVLALGMLTCISKAFHLINKRREGTNDFGELSRTVRRGVQAGDAPFPPLPPEEGGGEGKSLMTSTITSPHPDPLPEGEGIKASPISYLQLHTIPSEDPSVYDMIGDADTIGVFQIESRAQMAMLPRLRPRNFYDLVIEVAIVRPGPIQGNMVHPYLKRRAGEEPVTFPSEALHQVLEKTLGVPLFQEQAMKISMVAAGFSAEEADRLRRAMAAWRRSGVIEQFHQKIVQGMVANGYAHEFAEQCFLQIKGFGEYGFPESHAASFALLVYVSAWLKRYHPAAFAAALINSQPMGFYHPAQIVRDARDHGVEVRPPDVNESQWDCTLEAICDLTSASSVEPRLAICDLQSSRKSDWGRGGPALRLGFRQIKGFSKAHADRIVAARQADGRFGSVTDFHYRGGLPVAALKTLAEADAFSSLGLSRRRALWEVLRLKDEENPLMEKARSAPPAARNRDGNPRHGGTEAPSEVHAEGVSSPPLPPGEGWGEGNPQAPLPAPHPDPLPEGEGAEASSPLPVGVSVPPCPSFDEPPVTLPTMPMGQEVMIDYSTAGLSLKQHPVALVRDELTKRNILTSRQLNQALHGRWVKVAGLVLIRQRPGTASGIVFETLEDETGIINLIVKPDIYDLYRPAARHAGLLQADGYVQRSGQVLHVMAKRLHDLSHLLRGYELRSRDFH